MSEAVHPILNGDALVACRRYNAVRHRLGNASFTSQSEQIANLSELSSRIDLFVLDGYGVLNIGPDAIHGAVDRVASLREAGARVVVLTNGATLPKPATMDKYRSLGFQFSEQEVVSSRDALEHHLTNAGQKRRWAFMSADDSAIEELAKQPLRLLDDPADYEAAEGFVLLSTAQWNDHRQNLLIESVRRRARPVLVGNPDLVAPFADQFSLEPGWYAHELADITKCQPAFFGKPFANVFDIIRQRFGPLDPDRTAMVGDTLHTDILGGAMAGLKTVLISGHGLLRGQDIDAAIEQSGIRPDFIARDP